MDSYFDAKKLSKRIFERKDIGKLIRLYEEEIKKIKSEEMALLELSEDRLRQVSEWDSEANYKCLGHTDRDGRRKYILLIIRYPDGTQKEFRWVYDKIADLRKDMKELREIYPGDWSEFTEYIR